MKAARRIGARVIAFQGELGAFSQQAVRQLLGPSATVLPCIRFEDIFNNLKQGNVAGAMVPIENTLAGSVHENYDHLLNFELPIVAETSVRIVHNLLAPKGVAFRQIKRVFSHPVALNQCLDFFLANPQIERIPYYDTAGSAKMVVEEGLTDSGAIASAPRVQPTCRPAFRSWAASSTHDEAIDSPRARSDARTECTSSRRRSGRASVAGRGSGSVTEGR